MKSAVLVSGLLIAFPAFGQSVKVPGPAAKAGYTQMTFGPKVTMGQNWYMWTDAAAVKQNPNGTVTLSGGGNGYNAHIATATPNADGTYTGTAFGGGGYFEATMSFTGAPVTNGGWPSFWANDIENQIQALTGNGASQWQGQAQGYVNSIEVDITECLSGAGSYGIALHDWYGQQSAIQDVSSGDVSGSPVSLPAKTDTSKQHSYGFLWIPATASSKGTAQWFFDGVQVGKTVSWDQFNPATPPPPVVGSSAFSVLDSRNLYLILGTGPSNPMTVNQVTTAWQTPGAKASPLANTTNNITTEQAQINGAIAFDKAMAQVQATGTVNVATGTDATPQAVPTAPTSQPTATVSKGIRQPATVSGSVSAPTPVGTATLAPDSSSFTMPSDLQSRITGIENEQAQIEQEIAALKQDIATSSGSALVAQTTGGTNTAGTQAGPPPKPSKGGKQDVDDPDVPGAADD